MNTSPRKLFQNYRELVTEKAAKEYFGVVPQKKGIQDKGKAAGKASGNAPKKRSPSSKKLVPGSPASRSKSVKKLAPAK